MDFSHEWMCYPKILHLPEKYSCVNIPSHGHAIYGLE